MNFLRLFESSVVPTSFSRVTDYFADWKIRILYCKSAKKVLMEQDFFFNEYDDHSVIKDERRIFLYARVRSLVGEVFVALVAAPVA